MKSFVKLALPAFLLPAMLLTGCENPGEMQEASAPVPRPGLQDPSPAANVSKPDAEVEDVDLTTIGLSDHGWYQSYSQALAKSKETGKPIMIDFTGSDWCGWCIRLHDEVFSKDEFESWANDNVVLLELDFPRSFKLPASLKQQNDELMKKHKVGGFPTILFLDSNEEVLGKYGYDQGGPEVWLAKADKIISRSAE